MTSKIDVEFIQNKYVEERDKRINHGDRHYIDPLKTFPGFDRDPWVTEEIHRDAIIEDVDVVVTGGGFGGLVAAAKLKDAGVTDIRMIDIAGDFGGTWYWNRYPGIRCDVESYVYMPLLEEVGTIPTEKYSTGKEILEHARAIGRHYGLYEKALFQTRITQARWDEASSRWHVKTDRGDILKARFLLAANGFLSYPKLSNIPGIKDFKGKLIHPSRWDAKYSGGSSSGNLTGLKDKRVALIGTGATGIQILPHLAKDAKLAYLFQRTPAAVDARNNRPTDINWFKSQKPGWQNERMVNFDSVISGKPYDIDLVDDCWTHAAGPLFKAARTGAGPAAYQAMQLYDYTLMQSLRDKVDNIVKDPKTAESLKAWYNLFCKRPLYADDYIQCFNAPNVKLIDTDGAGVERITETGLVANGVHYEVDCIIVASGFQIGAYDKKTTTYPIIGRDGKPLSEKWGNGLNTLHGLWLDGHPNFQLIGSFNDASASFNYTWLATEHAIHAAAIISRSLKAGVTRFEVTSEAAQRWHDTIIARAMDNSAFAKQCTPGYFNNEGDTSKPGPYGILYGGGAQEYLELLRKWRETDYKTDAIIKTKAQE